MPGLPWSPRNRETEYVVRWVDVDNAILAVYHLEVKLTGELAVMLTSYLSREGINYGG